MQGVPKCMTLYAMFELRVVDQPNFEDHIKKILSNFFNHDKSLSTS